ncbi:DUF4431 domain-containing protein [Sphingomonas sp. PL-96]|uniref:DUF4431 domain-containing protein n=1 Tax=Sphingomonas sp. PL-96 TaxID=2887201 RepID=UPI001E286882|nr:DUF4431 domain-containing protein [Sphingomonas sp. PL-96]MCC2976944.1 DUF4431 domain-containing protein [Sphingomonas sp. PL-96]
MVADLIRGSGVGWALAATALLVGAPAEAQLLGKTTAQGCVSVADADPVQLSGMLSQQVFPGPPGYEDVAQGDAPERTFVLTLPAPACIDDGGDFADPDERFTAVQVAASDPRVRQRLRRAIGTRVTLSGEGFAAHTGHHHLPLVVLVDRLHLNR